MINNLDIEAIRNRADTIFAQIPKNKWRYYHKKSIDNFIFHLCEIKGRSEKKELYETINSYLDEVEDGFDEVNMQLSEYLFNAYLNKLVNRFQWRLGFVPVFPNRSLIVFIPIITFLLFFVYTKNIYIFYFIVIFIILYIIRIIFKMLKKKVYGFGY